MTHFEYISVLISIVIAFGISELLSGWARLLRARERVRFYWIHALLSLFVLVWIVQMWSGFWEFRNHGDWSFFDLMGMLVDFLPLLVIMVIATPSVEGEGPIDLREHYYHNRVLVFGIAAFAMVQLAVSDAVVGGQPVWHAENAIRALGLVVALTLAVSRSERVHGALLGFAFVLLSVFAAVAWRSGGE